MDTWLNPGESEQISDAGGLAQVKVWLLWLDSGDRHRERLARFPDAVLSGPLCMEG